LLTKHPMADVIELYFNNTEKCEKVLNKIVRKLKKDNKFYVSDLSFNITENDKIHKVRYSINYKTSSDRDLWGLSFGEESRKIYELAFADYEYLDSEQVLEAINGFTAFLRKHEFAENKVKEKIDYFAELLLMNPNLPDDLELWTKLR
jgi:hypothetical protein